MKKVKSIFSVMFVISVLVVIGGFVFDPEGSTQLLDQVVGQIKAALSGITGAAEDAVPGGGQ